MEELGSADAFDRMGTLGIEEEFFVVDVQGRPTSGTDELVYESDPPTILDGRLDHELFKCVVETQTPTLSGIGEAADALADVRAALVDHADSHGFGIAAAGLHPAAQWRELDHAEKRRYRAQLDRIQYPQHRNTTAGLHVHVGVDDAEKATWVSNRLRWHLPLLLALSANSPFWNGFDTGLASARSVVFENLPNTGTPTTFGSFEEYLRLERLLVETDSISDRGELWYDVRPHTGHGTVEVRTPDAQRDEWRVLAFAEYVRALVVDYAERYEDHPDPWSDHGEHRRETLDENKWRATRWGREASFIDRACSSVVTLADAVESECDRLGVTGLRDVLDVEGGATTQRRMRDEGGLDEVCRAVRL